MTYSKITLNLMAANSREETLEGRTHVVVPMVILTEGVHAGSAGPVFYPKDELEKTPEVWNHKPVVVYHPTLNGEGISACQPDVINNRKVGLMLNTKFANNRLTSEAWIEKDRADLIDDRILKAVKAKEMMELSTGLFFDGENTTGKWKSEDYSLVARNYRPDHLALLPDQIGACSIADGAGFLRNQAADKRSPVGQAFHQLLTKMGLADNEMSYSNIHSALSQKLRDQLKVGENGPYIWVVDVFSNFFIYEKENEFWRLGYMSNDTDVSLSDETPVKVKRVTEYRTVDGSFVGNHRPAEEETETTAMKTQKEKVDGIIAANAGWAETDRAALMAYNDKQLDIVVNGITPPATPPPVAPPVTPPAAPPVVPPPVTPSAPPKVVNVQEYVDNAPPEVREVLRNSMQSLNEEKTKLVDVILANESNEFAKEELNTRPLGELRKLARLSAATSETAQASYAGMAPVGNATTSGEAPLEIPVMNFDKKTAAA